ncbi:MAG: copper chaperone PCu(A)C [Methylotenera sp.]
MNTLLSTSTLQRLLRYVLLLTLAASSTYINAKDIVSIENAWVRPTIAGQDVGAAYMTFVSTQDATLIHAESNVTKSVEIHSMTMQNGVMKMRMLETLPLTAGKPYKLEPGGFHLMLFDLKKPLAEGEQVNFELTFKSKNVEFKQQVKALVKTPVSDETNNGGSNSHEHHNHHH